VQQAVVNFILIRFHSVSSLSMSIGLSTRVPHRGHRKTLTTGDGPTRISDRIYLVEVPHSGHKGSWAGGSAILKTNEPSARALRVRIAVQLVKPVVTPGRKHAFAEIR
jgi:hypothetical protein